MRLLQEYLASQAEIRPDSPALHWNAKLVSYGALERRANQLAWMLKQEGCRPGDRVALLLPKGPLAITAMQAVLKADCCYTPLDPQNPPIRIARVLDALECRCVLAVAATGELLLNALDQLRDRRLPLPWIGLLEPEIDARACEARFSLSDLELCPAHPPPSHNGSLAPAHILFTSGSTGIPKGVVITHANVIHFVDWAVQHFGMEPTDRVSGHSPLHFDLSTFDVYGTFAAGATLYPIPPEANLLPHKLALLIEDAGLTQWFSVPSILNHMAKLDVIRPGAFPCLRRLLWCGERFPTSGLMYWMQRLPQVQFTNLYGPTETTIASSYYQVPSCPRDEWEEVPIGQGCDGEELLVLDSDLRPVPEGAQGDLYLRGPGVSPGYWRDSARTEAVFIPDPFSDRAADRLYKTGDLARVDEQGRVVLLGRADSQVKTRGYRIELGEIEAALDAVAELQESAVVPIASNGFEGNILCCAYVARPGGEVPPTLLRQRLARVLPGYMLPTRWKQLDRLPLNQNGKTDRSALRDLWPTP
jgi:amino acid adenylation domain-containing protein